MGGSFSVSGWCGGDLRHGATTRSLARADQTARPVAAKAPAMSAADQDVAVDADEVEQRCARDQSQEADRGNGERPRPEPRDEPRHRADGPGGASSRSASPAGRRRSPAAGDRNRRRRGAGASASPRMTGPLCRRAGHRVTQVPSATAARTVTSPETRRSGIKVSAGSPLERVEGVDVRPGLVDGLRWRPGALGDRTDPVVDGVDRREQPQHPHRDEGRGVRSGLVRRQRSGAHGRRSSNGMSRSSGITRELRARYRA